MHPSMDKYIWSKTLIRSPYAQTTHNPLHPRDPASDSRRDHDISDPQQRWQGALETDGMGIQQDRNTPGAYRDEADPGRIYDGPLALRWYIHHAPPDDHLCSLYRSGGV
jgi:hypothetical protein